jgi:hypothetical protein
MPRIQSAAENGTMSGLWNTQYAQYRTVDYQSLVKGQSQKMAFCKILSDDV